MLTQCFQFHRIREDIERVCKIYQQNRADKDLYFSSGKTIMHIYFSINLNHNYLQYFFILCILVSIESALM